MINNPIRSLWLLWGETNAKREDKLDGEEGFEQEELVTSDLRIPRHNSLCGYFLVTLVTLVISVKVGKGGELDRRFEKIRVVDDVVQYYGSVVQF
jgi:hypothetical protein